MATCFMACASGVTSAPLNPAYRADEFEFYLSDLNAKALIVEQRQHARRRSTWPRSWACACIDLVADAGAPAGSFTLEPRDGARRPRRPRTAASPQPDDVSMVLHTSGTTSRPKIVPLSQAQPGAPRRTQHRATRCSSRRPTAA